MLFIWNSTLKCILIIPSNYLKIFLALFICLGNRSIVLISVKGIHGPVTYKTGNTGIKRQTFWECYIFSLLNDQNIDHIFRVPQQKEFLLGCTNIKYIYYLIIMCIYVRKNQFFVVFPRVCWQCSYVTFKCVPIVLSVLVAEVWLKAWLLPD